MIFGGRCVRVTTRMFGRTRLLTAQGSSAADRSVGTQSEVGSEVFRNQEEHRDFLGRMAEPLPRGFAVGCSEFEFVPEENREMRAHMRLTILKLLDGPTKQWAAVFTSNAACGAPIMVGRRMLEQSPLGAIVVNNKISNVFPAGDGVRDAEQVCEIVADALDLPSKDYVLPSSTGVIGWRLPVDEMIASIPDAVKNLQDRTALPAAEAIMTTDLYPKVRRSDLGHPFSLVGIAKGAGMVEPNLATMLVFLMTDLDLPQERLQSMLAKATDESFNCISIDSDQSTSDTVVLVSSGAIRPDNEAVVRAFESELERVCANLAADVVRNGEGVRHVLRVNVTGAPTDTIARGIGKAVVNSPLTKCAFAGNDPNVGRVIGAVGSYVGRTCGDRKECAQLMANCTVDIAGETVFDHGNFTLSTEKEARLVTQLRDAELYVSAPIVDASVPSAHFAPTLEYPPHDRCVDIDVRFDAEGEEETACGWATILGSDLTHEYVTENADYRS